VLINTAGFLQSKSQQTGEQSSQQVTDRLEVLTATGEVSNLNGGDYNLSAINATVKKAPGASDIDLENVTIQWIGPDGTESLVQNNADVDATSTTVFQNTTVKDADDSAPVLNDPDDRIDVDIQLDQPNAGTLDRLEPGETATLTLTTQSGATSELRVEVPESLTEDGAVEL
jgi:flagellin FlaA/flagellin FlaB